MAVEAQEGQQSGCPNAHTHILGLNVTMLSREVEDYLFKLKVEVAVAIQPSFTPLRAAAFQARARKA